MDSSTLSRLSPTTGAMGLVTTSLLSGGSLQDVLEQSTPGYATLHSFFSRWLHIDITKLAMALTICGLLSGAISDVQNMARRFYWWVARFLTASISIAAHDQLNREVINWLGAHVLKPRSPAALSFSSNPSASRILTARSAKSSTTQSDAFLYFRHMERDAATSGSTTLASSTDRRPPVQYLPTFSTVWFMFERNIFVVRRVQSDSIEHKSSNYVPHTGYGVGTEYADAAAGEDPLVVMCLGRSVAPVKRFLGACREFADQQADKFVTVRTTKGGWRSDAWNVSVLRPRRSLDSVHFDRRVKDELIRDITTYLHPSTRRFYMSRGIPYRRGYLLYGPPGTGKTSLSLALAAHFKLDLHLVHLPGLCEDSDLDKLFVTLPPRCLVLLEDIDCVGIKRKGIMKPTAETKGVIEESLSSEDDVESDQEHGKIYGQVTLSGLLNVLDGVTSQEGRIVLMTSNIPEDLDEALVRPGRVDKKIYLGYLSKDSAEEMFIRMYDETLAVAAEQEDLFSDSASSSTNPFASAASASDASASHIDASYRNPRPHWDRETLHRLAFQFAQITPHERFSPAAVQGFLLDHKDSPYDALRHVDEWVVSELHRVEEAERLTQRLAEKKLAKRRNERIRRKVKHIQEQNELKKSMKTSLAEQQRIKKAEEKARRCATHHATVSHVSDSDATATKATKKSRKSKSSKAHKHKHTHSSTSSDSDHGNKSSSTSSFPSTSTSTISRDADTASQRSIPVSVTTPEPDPAALAAIAAKPRHKHHRRKSSLQTKTREALIRPTATAPMETISHLIQPAIAEVPEEENSRGAVDMVNPAVEMVAGELKVAEAVDTVKPAETDKTTEPSKLIQVVQNVEPIESIEPVKSVDSTPTLVLSAMTVKETEPVQNTVHESVHQHPPSNSQPEPQMDLSQREPEHLQPIAEEEDQPPQLTSPQLEQLTQEVTQNRGPLPETDRSHEGVHDEIERNQHAHQIKERLDKIEEEPEQPMDEQEEVQPEQPAQTTVQPTTPTTAAPAVLPDTSSTPAIPTAQPPSPPIVPLSSPPVPQNPQITTQTPPQTPSTRSSLEHPISERPTQDIHPQQPLPLPSPQPPQNLPRPNSEHNSSYRETFASLLGNSRPGSRPNSLKKTDTNESTSRNREGSPHGTTSAANSILNMPTSLRPISRPGTAGTTGTGTATPPLPSSVSQPLPQTTSGSLFSKLPMLRRRTSLGAPSIETTSTPRSKFQSAVGSVIRGRRASSASMAAPVVDLSGASRHDLVSLAAKANSGNGSVADGTSGNQGRA